ncbi:ABC transporter permease/M1 family aminopeptidase [Guptibacillus hwajinpoensis]|uniref:ABC transporter permease/M1 family aminopeptidase n=1 Tax=Guptibacillus hwajinpoensis TaxID=208199 RepID=UPI00384E8CC4
MRKWLIQFKLEFSFLYKNWFFAPLPFLYMIWLLFSMSADQEGGHGNLYRTTYETTHSLIFILVIGLSILIGVYLIRRDVGNESFEWHQSFPVSNFVFISAKLMSALIYMTIYTVLMSGTYFIFAMRDNIPVEETFTILRFYGTQYEVAFFISLTLGMLLSVLIKNRFVYLIAFCAWMFGTLFMEIFIIDQGGHFYLKAFHLTYLFVDSVLVNGTWGIELMKEELQLQRIFVLTVSSFLLVLIIFILNKRRPHPYTWLWKVVLMISIGIVVISYLPYASFWKERTDEFSKIKQESPLITDEQNGQASYMSFPSLSSPNTLMKEEEELYQPERFEIKQFDLSIQHEDQSLFIDASLTLPSAEFQTKEFMKFTLNQTFSVNQVTIDQQPIPFTQENDFLTVTLPENMKEPVIRVQYKGRYKLWASNNGQEYYPGHVGNDQMIMPSQTAWYPLPGHQYLYDTNGESQTNIGISNRATFNVEVSGMALPLYGTIDERNTNVGTYKLQGETSKLDLYAGDLTEVDSTYYPMSIVTDSYNRDRAIELIKELDKRLLYTNHYLTKKIEPMRHFFIVPVENIRWANYVRQQGFIDQNYILSESTFYQMDETYLMKLLFQVSLFHDGTEIYGYEDGELVTSAIQTAYTYIYELENGNKKKANQIRDLVITIQDNIPLEDYSEEEIKANQIFTMINEAIADGDSKQVKEVLDRIYSERWVDPGFAADFTLFREPSTLIPYEEWQKIWDEVMQDHQTRKEDGS